MFWALLLKIQSAITPSMPRVRGSSLDTRNLSPTPLNNIPNQAQEMKLEKKFVEGKRTVTKNIDLMNYCVVVYISRYVE